MRDSYDPTPPSTVFGRARYTPLADVLRGRLTARLDPRTLIAQANLPEPLPGVIYTVARRSRLWLGEQTDVVRELVAHFADGLESGRSAEQLVNEFGPPAQAARLIRRAKRRNRPLPWQMLRWTGQALLGALALFLVVYGVLALRFFLAAPQVAHNYWHDINEARRVHNNDAAWPIYRQALIALGDPRDKVNHPRVEWGWADAGPEGPHWDEFVKTVEIQRPAIQLAREAARKPRLGYLVGDLADYDFYRKANADWIAQGPPQDANDNPELLSTLLGGVQNLRDLARFVDADAIVAAAQDDGPRALEDLTTMVRMAEQIWQPRSYLVEQMIAMAVYRIALERTVQIADKMPACFSDEQLRDLAHVLAAFRQGDLMYDMSAEEIAFDDLLQRFYTDDGRGDGHVTLKGLEWWTNNFPAIPDKDQRVWQDALLRVAGPGFAALVAGRAETRELYQRVAQAEADAHQGPPWEWDRQEIKDADRVLQEPDLNKVRYFLAGLVQPMRSGLYINTETMIQRRDATLTVIALELYHRRHNAWPTKLDELVPALLPAVSLDRFDGQPLRYVVREGRPVLYSLGADLDDDGGQPTKRPSSAEPGSDDYGKLTAAERERRQRPNAFGIPEGEIYNTERNGDWVFFPPQYELWSEPEAETVPDADTTESEAAGPEQPEAADVPASLTVGP